jgi:hypothetical protein
VKAQQSLVTFMAAQLAQTSDNLLSSQPELALRLAAEAVARSISAGAQDNNPVITAAMQNALKANATFDFGQAIQQSWFLDNTNYAVIDYAEKPDELWQLNPPKMVAEFQNPIEQIIPVGGGKLFLVDYADDAPDELWRTEEQTVAAQLNGDIASPPDPAANIKTPNVVRLDNDTYFVLKYAGGQSSELWEDAAAERVAVLDGDIRTVTPLKDGYFFAGYTNVNLPAGIWQTDIGIMVQSADDVVTTSYDNGIFALRRSLQYDEIWRTNPFAMVTPVVGRVDTVTNLYQTPYFIVQYAGGAPAEIWRDSGDPELVYKFRGGIDTSETFSQGQYFFVRYDDKSASELWTTDPLGVAATLGGHVANMAATTLLDQEEIVFDYENNAISEVWSLKGHTRLAQLNGNVQKVIPIMGDVFFAVQYEGEQPAEIWSAVNAKLVSTLGDVQRHVKSITVLKDGAYVVVTYDSAPAEIWQIATGGVTRAATLSEAVTDILPFASSDYFVVNYAESPAQVWQTATITPIITFNGRFSKMGYNQETKRFGIATVDHATQVLSLDRLTQALALNTDADLLVLACQQLQENGTTADNVLDPYLGDLPPIACAGETLN